MAKCNPPGGFQVFRELDMYQSLRGMIVIMLLSFLFTIVLPIAVMRYENLLDEQPIRERVSDTLRQFSPTKLERLKAYESDYKRRDEALRQIESKVLEFIKDGRDPQVLIDTARYLLTLKSLSKAPTELSPHSYLGIYETGFLFISYISLGVILLVTAGPDKPDRGTLVWGLLALCIQRAPHWGRNVFYLGEDIRKIYAPTNLNVGGWVVFIVHEITWFGLFILLIFAWQKWIYLSACSKDFISKEPKDVLSWGCRRWMSDIILYWGIASMLLMMAFLPYTFEYWDLVFKVNDHRYVLSAVIQHLLWIWSWMMISQVLLLAWYKWDSFKERYLANSFNPLLESKEGAQAKVELLRELAPLTSWGVLLSALASAASLAAPILVHLFKS